RPAIEKRACRKPHRRQTTCIAPFPARSRIRNTRLARYIRQPAIVARANTCSIRMQTTRLRRSDHQSRLPPRRRRTYSYPCLFENVFVDETAQHDEDRLNAVKDEMHDK